jgi:putative redox protein
MTSQVVYSGNLRTRCTHLRSGQDIITDAPTDNHGLGEAFSPTDLMSTALASCMFTIMGIKAKDLNIDLNGMKAEVLKVMADQPRRVSRIEIEVSFPEGLVISEKHRKILENSAKTCPVYLSLSESLEKVIHFHWRD